VIKKEVAMDLGLRSRTSRPAAGAAAPAYNVALGHLRAFVVFLVVVHHSVLAYFPNLPAPAHQFAGGEMLWRAFPVLDSTRWALTPLIAWFNDIFFMALMFLLSGLFVTKSVEGKGLALFLRDRVLRLGIPFLFAAGIVAPIAYYTAYLQTGGAPGLSNYWRAWNAIGYWPTGPAWFVLLLLVYDAIAAVLFLLLPDWGNSIGRLAQGARERPARFFWIVAGLSFVAYAPLAIVYGWDGWTYLGLLQFQTSRIVHYFVYFAIGVGIGAVGLQNSLVAADGNLTRRWGRWVLAMIGAFLLAIAVSLWGLATKGQAQTLLIDLGTVTFALSCAASGFGFLAIFTRFARRPSVVWRSASDNSYGIYLVHYAFVAWCQYALLSTSLSGGAKAALVIAAAYPLSWGTAALLRRIPLVAKIV
jgi:peptidoglycan/LPS O-acetylase OafA/YrhL